MYWVVHSLHHLALSLYICVAFLTLSVLFLVSDARNFELLSWTRYFPYRLVLLNSSLLTLLLATFDAPFHVAAPTAAYYARNDAKNEQKGARTGVVQVGPPHCPVLVFVASMPKLIEPKVFKDVVALVLYFFIRWYWGRNIALAITVRLVHNDAKGLDTSFASSTYQPKQQILLVKCPSLNLIISSRLAKLDLVFRSNEGCHRSHACETMRNLNRVNAETFWKYQLLTAHTNISSEGF